MLFFLVRLAWAHSLGGARPLRPQGFCHHGNQDDRCDDFALVVARSATGAATAAYPNPVVMRIVRLLAAATVADDRIAFTSGTSSQNDFPAARGPIRFELV
jgi:hypothetical protein